MENSFEDLKFKNKLDTTKVLYDNAFIRLSTEYSDCSMPVCMDQYNVCSGNCMYCFAYNFKMTNPMLKEMHNLKAAKIKTAEELFTGKSKNMMNTAIYEKIVKPKKVIQWGGLADPFDGYERQFRVGEEIMKIMIDQNIPIRFSTKFSIPDNIKLLLESNKNRNMAFMYSIITNDDSISRKIEEETTLPSIRWQQLKYLSDLGYYTIVRLRPFMVGITERSLDEIFENILKYKVNAISTEFFALQLCCEKKVRERNNHLFTEISTFGVDYYKLYQRASKNTGRGTYLRLNRDFKEKYIRKLYKFCTENNVQLGISDPDYKELNFSGSCCGLPDYDQNNGRWGNLSNYQRSQMTELLIRKKKEFWEKNNVDDLLKNKITDVYMDINDFVKLDSKDIKFFFPIEGSNVDVLGSSSKQLMVLPQGEVRNTILFDLLLKNHWNNLSGPTGIQNYFHNKIVFDHFDDNENAVYKYNPMPYEIVWQKDFGLKI
jgi:DNA repair photolyase